MSRIIPSFLAKNFLKKVIAHNTRVKINITGRSIVKKAFEKTIGLIKAAIETINKVLNRLLPIMFPRETSSRF